MLRVSRAQKNRLKKKKTNKKLNKKQSEGRRKDITTHKPSYVSGAMRTGDIFSRPQTFLLVGREERKINVRTH